MFSRTARCIPLLSSSALIVTTAIQGEAREQIIFVEQRSRLLQASRWFERHTEQESALRFDSVRTMIKVEVA
jgi:hypothetical protein